MKKKKYPCGLELKAPKLAPVSCPACGLVIGKGAFLHTGDPCFDKSWGTDDYVVIEGVRIDRTSTLVPKVFHGHKCERCPVNRRKGDGPWPPDVERRE